MNNTLLSESDQEEKVSKKNSGKLISGHESSETSAKDALQAGSATQV